METPVKLHLDGIENQDKLRADIMRHLAQLEERYGRVTAGRIMVKPPGGHHLTGGLFEISIRLALPEGREINISRTAQQDERYSDLTFAVNDAFKRARRSLQDEARKLQRHVKTHDGPLTATVIRLDPTGEFGFLETADGHEAYFHCNSVINDGFKELVVGSRVSFVEVMGEKGPQASTVKPLGKHRMRL